MRNSFFAFALSVFAGCGPSGGSPDMDMGSSDMAIVTLVPTNFDTINSDILQPTCAKFSVCHSPAGASSADHLDLSMLNGNDPWTQLVNMMAQNKKAMAMGLVLVKPCDADHSFLQQKISMTMDLDKDTDFGHHMPSVDGEFLSAAQIQAVKDWINRGALKSEPVTVSGSTCQLFQDMGPSKD